MNKTLYFRFIFHALLVIIKLIFNQNEVEMVEESEEISASPVLKKVTLTVLLNMIELFYIFSNSINKKLPSIGIFFERILFFIGLLLIYL